MRKYELVVLLHPDLEIDVDTPITKIESIITNAGGTVTKKDNWGKRKLAYSVKGHDHAVYVFYSAEIPAANVRKIEATLNITDEVIRFLITRPDEKAIAKAEAFKAKRKGKKETTQEAAKNE